MPRVAFMVLCHQQPELVHLLAEKLHHDNCVTVVHVDKRASVATFQQDTPRTSPVRFVPDNNRVAIHWGGFSMVEATLATIRHTLAVAPLTERFVLLSGSDYPVYPVGEILDRLSGTDEFIRVDHKLDPNGNGWFDTCANRVFLGDGPLLNPRKLAEPANRIVRKVKRRLKRRTPYGSSVFYGPSWWSLTRSAINHILEVYQTAPEKVNWFKRARSPDEMVFQTLMQASPYADRIKYDATAPDGCNMVSRPSGGALRPI